MIQSVDGRCTREYQYLGRITACTYSEYPSYSTVTYTYSSTHSNFTSVLSSQLLLEVDSSSTVVQRTKYEKVQVLQYFKDYRSTTYLSKYRIYRYIAVQNSKYKVCTILVLPVVENTRIDRGT
jgi:hypothetical protein